MDAAQIIRVTAKGKALLAITIEAKSILCAIHYVVCFIFGQKFNAKIFSYDLQIDCSINN